MVRLPSQLVRQGCSAHEAEARATEQIRQLGKGILTERAEKCEAMAVAKARAHDPELRSYRKRLLTPPTAGQQRA